MNKRGEWSTLQLISTIGGVIVAILLVGIVLRTVPQHGAENQFIVTDTALLSDAILSAPGDVEIVYPGKLIGRFTRLRKNSIEIYDHAPKLNESSIYKYSFIPRGDVHVLEKDLGSDVVYFVKNNNVFTISNYPLIDEGVSND